MTEELDDKPPFFNRWSTLYWFVLLSLGMVILLLYIFSIAFS